MVRRYDDLVEVRPAPDGDRPGSFLWRGRLYVVRDVLGHWRERRAWWTSAAARAVHGDGGQTMGGPEPVSDGAVSDGAVSDGAVSGAAGAARAALAGEREVWRVEASRGWVHGTGVFDLSREVVGSGDLSVGVRTGSDAAVTTGASGAREDAWRLVRVTD